MRFGGKLAFFIALGSLVAGALAQGGTQTQRQDRAAQVQQGQRGRAMQQALDKLNLTPKQKQQIEKAREEWRKSMDAARSEQDREKRRSQWREAGRSFREKLDKILTVDQKKKFEAELKKLREERGPQQGPANADKKGQKGGQGQRAAGEAKRK